MRVFYRRSDALLSILCNRDASELASVSVMILFHPVLQSREVVEYMLHTCLQLVVVPSDLIHYFHCFIEALFQDQGLIPHCVAPLGLLQVALRF
jgi:hypothetical protein